MEGNFRIVQLSDCEFIIEKEAIETIKHPWYTFKKPSTISKWRRVDKKGRFLNVFYLPSLYMATTLTEAKDTLIQIKKYPLVINE